MTTPPQTRSPGQLARELFETIFDRKDPDAIRPYGTEDSVDHFLALGRDLRGPDQIASYFREVLAAVPDAAMTIENIVEDDRHAVVQWSFTGTFEGAPFQGIEPTGRWLTLRGCDVFRFTEDGKVAENTIYYDGAEFARQIGMLPRRDSVADKGMTQAFNGVTRLRRRIGLG
ncbi:MAG TPA: ester cyclase [Thermoleophilaceae bacterium]|nr:ester cyclase [Thermoleophilaceae bacterium]